MKKIFLVFAGIIIFVFAFTLGSSQLFKGSIFLTSNNLDRKSFLATPDVAAPTTDFSKNPNMIASLRDRAWFYDNKLGFKFKIPDGFVLQRMSNDHVCLGLKDIEDVVVRTESDFQNYILKGREYAEWRPALTFQSFYPDKKSLELGLLDWMKTKYAIPKDVQVSNFYINGLPAVKYVQNLGDHKLTGIVFDVFKSEIFLEPRVVIFATSSISDEELDQTISSITAVDPNKAFDNNN